MQFQKNEKRVTTIAHDTRDEEGTKGFEELRIPLAFV
jgi:hypothetical protein